MKKYIALVLTSLMLLLVACGGASPGSTGQTSTGGSGGSSGSSGSAASGPSLTLKLGTLNPGDHPYNQGANKFADEVSQLTNGKVKIKVYPNAQLGNARDQIEGLQTGTQDFHVSSIAPLSGFVPLAGVVQLPYLFKSPAQAYIVANGAIGKQLSAAAEKKGIKILAFFTNGFRSFTNDTRPIKEPSDMKGLKIRVQKSNVYVDLVKALGATPVPLAYSQLYTALQQKTVDGEENPPVNVTVKKFYEVQKYYSLDRHDFDLVPILMSLKTWNKLSPSEQQAVQKAALDAANFEWKIDLQTNQKDLKDLRSKMQVNDVDRAAFVKVMKDKMWPNYYDKYGKKLINQIVNTPVDQSKIPDSLKSVLGGS